MLAFLLSLLLQATSGAPGDADSSLVLRAEGSGAAAVQDLGPLDGGLHSLWVEGAAPALLLEVTGPSGRRTSERDSGGVGTPWLALETAAGEELSVRVSSAEAEAGAEVRLVLRYSPESEATRAAARRAEATLADLAQAPDPLARLEAVLVGLEAAEGQERSPEIARVRRSLAAAAAERGALALQARALAPVLERLERTLPRDHPELIALYEEDAKLAFERGDWFRTRALRQALHDHAARVGGPDSPDALRARRRLAVAIKLTGDYAGAIDMLRSVEEALAEVEGVDPGSLLVTRGQLGLALYQAGRFDEAREVLRRGAEGAEGALPVTDVDVLWLSEIELLVLRDVGRHEEALDRAQELLPLLEETQGVGSVEALSAQATLGLLLMDLGRWYEARELFEENLLGWEAVRPPDHPDVLGALQNLAWALESLGALDEALHLLGDLEARYRTLLPAGHQRLLELDWNLARVMMSRGDAAGCVARLAPAARELEALLGPEHPTVIGALATLARAQRADGRFEEALRLHVAAADRLGLSREKGDLDLAVLHTNVAEALIQLGRPAAALERLEEVLPVLEARHPAGHPRLALVRGTQAVALYQLGELAAAQALQERSLEELRASFSASSDEVLGALSNLASTTWAAGADERTRELLEQLMDGIRARVDELQTLPPRVAAEALLARDPRLWMGQLLSFARTQDEAFERRVFEVVHRLRGAELLAAGNLGRAARDPELRGLWESAARTSEALADAIHDPLAGGAAGRVARLTLERDLLQRAILEHRSEGGAIGPSSTSFPERAWSPPRGSALVAYSAYSPWERDGDAGPFRVGREALLVAHVWTHEDRLRRVELGSLSVVEDTIRRWRASMGVAGAARGLGLAQPSTSHEEELGQALYAQLVGPVRELLGEECQRLHAVLCEGLVSVPLDALPSPSGAPLGDGLLVLNARTPAGAAASEARLGTPAPTSGSVLLVGAVDYGGPPDGDAVEGAARASAGDFVPLPGTGSEVRAIAALAEEVWGEGPELLTGKAPTPAALRAVAGEARFLHLATHGYIAPEEVAARGHGMLEGPEGMRWGSTGLAPLTLCGLALAGANGGRDSTGRARGLLTAEELATFPLADCALVVLSACETNVGVRRAGRGIQSLQTALLAAGAQRSITSLWKVDDEATALLMEAFYRALWIDERPAAEALWEAKTLLREAGHPLRDWAGWVLVGGAS